MSYARKITNTFFNQIYTHVRTHTRKKNLIVLIQKKNITKVLHSNGLSLVNVALHSALEMVK